MTYVVVGALTAMYVLVWFAWFICEIIIHSLDQDFFGSVNNGNRGGFLQLLVTQSMLLYQYNGILMAGALAALHLASSVKTRASRVSSFVVQMFSFLAWFFELYFIIPTFYSSSNGSNLFCGYGTVTPTQSDTNGNVNFASGVTGEVSVCRLARAIAALAVVMQFVQGLVLLYSFAQIFIAPRLEDGTRKEIIEEDDAEVATVVQANPAGYALINRRVALFSYLNLFAVLTSLVGYAVFMYSLIDVVRSTGFTNGANYSAYVTSNWIVLGDFVLSNNFRQLSLTLVFALAASGYAAFRHNRGIQAGALLLTFITTLQWWSLIIFSGRYLRQWRHDADYNSTQTNGQFPGQFPNDQTFNYYPALNAQRAMYAGACVILAGETFRTFFLLGRYFSYVPVTRNNVIPTYIRGAFATANPIPVLLFWFEALTIFAWWVLQFVAESESGIFNNVPGVQNGANTAGGVAGNLNTAALPFNIPMQNVVTETLFIWQTMYFLAVFIPELFSERTKTLASKQASLAVNVVIMCAYFLLSWPWSYAGSHNGGYWYSGTDASGNLAGVTYNNDGSPVFTKPTVDICDTAGYNCRLLQGASILSFISGLGFVLLFLYQIASILSKLPHPGQVATIDGTVVDALPPTVGVQKSLGWMVWLTLAGLAVWALTAIDVGSGILGWRAYTEGQMPSTPGLTYNMWRLLYAYTYSIAFPDIILLSFLVWAASELASNPVVANWHAWRTLVTGTAAMLFTFLIPSFILVCRYINWGQPYNLLKLERAVAAGFLILTIGETFLYANALLVQRSPLIALPAAINNTTMPVNKQGTELQNVAVQQPGVYAPGVGAPQAGYAPAAGVGVNNTAGNMGTYGQPNQYGHTETTVTTADPVPTREYSGNQVPPA